MRRSLKTAQLELLVGGANSTPSSFGAGSWLTKAFTYSQPSRESKSSLRVFLYRGAACPQSVESGDVRVKSGAVFEPFVLRATHRLFEVFGIACHPSAMLSASGLIIQSGAGICSRLDKPRAALELLSINSV